MTAYSGQKKEKLANTIVFFAEKIPNISKTKILKLLYLLEECYVRKYKVPFLDIDFEVWQAGPVNRDVYIELSETPVMLNGYIKNELDGDSTIIRPLKQFRDDEFSDNEIDMLNFIVDRFGEMTAIKLVELTHRPTSPWYIIAKEKGLIELFEQGGLRSSEEKIELDKFYCTDEWSKERFNGKKTFNSLSQYFRSV